MAARFSSSHILRSAVAVHGSLSATSLLCSMLGKSQDVQEQLQQTSKTSPTSPICAALPWLDQLHNLIAGMYTCGGLDRTCCTARLQQSDNNNNVMMVKIGQQVSFENPIVAYSGMGEMERAFRGRLYLHPQNDVKTLLECIDVEASEDSICGGEHGSLDHKQKQQQIGIPRSLSAPSSSPPKVKVTYRLSQQYGTYFSIQSLLVVTVQVRRGCSERIRRITPEKVAMPLATSGFTPRAASTMAVAANSGVASVALAKAADKLVAATNMRRRGVHSDMGSGSKGDASAPLVAEVVRIEEQWNGVQLLHFAPFHLSRRLNGLVAGSAAYFLFN